MVILLIIGLYLCSLYSYLLFHGIVEMYIISVAIATFLVTWNTRKLINDGYLVFLGVSFLFIGSVELLHTLSFKGMGVFKGYDANLPTQLWIAYGYMEGISFLCASLYVNRRVPAEKLTIVYFLVTSVLLYIIFSRKFPNCYIENSGLTLFKKASEIIISIILAVSAGLLYQKRRHFDSFVLKVILLGIGFNICSRIAFIFYVSVYGLSNQIGHYFQMASFYCIYKAIISTGLIRPHALLFRENEQQRLALQAAHEELERRIDERTKELLLANKQLTSEVIERTKVESLLNQRQEELKRINKELEDFAYIVSHDLREPLRGIHNFSNLLLNQYVDALDTDGRYMLDHLSQLSKRMEDQIVAILNFSKVGREGMVIKPTDLNEVLKCVLNSVMHFIQEYEADIQIPKPLPKVLCDPIMIQEVFSNLISNAVKYNDKPKRWVEIGYDSISSDNPFITFYVKDNGIGIKQDHMEKIFLIFQRLHSQKKYAGTGVGLTISKKIIERHGGRVWVESVLGKGTAFYFTLLKANDKLSNSNH